MAETQTPTREEHRTGGDVGSDAVWRVIVLNDDHNTFEGVAFALSATIPGLTYDRGMALANRIHRAGLAVVWSGHLELAEHYWDELRGLGLTMAPLEQ